MIAAGIALVAVLVAAAIAVRSAAPRSDPARAPASRGVDLAPKTGNAAAPASGAGADPAVAGTDSPAADEAVHLPPGQGSPERQTSHTVLVAGPPRILDDLRLDEVLEMAAESPRDAARPTLRLTLAICGFGLVFAAVAFLVVRGLGSLLESLLR